jgi:hypothetical protein
MKEITDHSKNLCETCERGCVVKGQTLNQEMIRCGYLDSLMPFRVAECSRFKNRTEKDIYELTQIAWLIDNKKGNIGFVKPKDLTREQKDELYELG